MTDEDLRHEAGIVWLENVQHLPWVRQKFVDGRTRQVTPEMVPTEGRIVGYTVARGGGGRRAFISKADDSDWHPSQCPSEAIDPRTISLGKVGGMRRR